MNSAKVDVFFSCSFKEEDAGINSFFRCICKALDIDTVNVSDGSPRTPPDKARELIEASQALIAIAVKREALNAGKFSMPGSVRDEIAIAYGLKRPILLFAEEGVDLEGFIPNYGTYKVFDRSKICEHDNLCEIISLIHGLKMEVVSPHDLLFEQDINEFYAEYMSHLVELKNIDSRYTWEYSSTKKIIFNKPYRRKLNTGAWASQEAAIPEGTKPIQFSAEIDKSSGDHTLHVEIIKQTATCCEASIKFSPSPEKGDEITYSTNVISEFINPTFIEDIAEHNSITVDDTNYCIYDGLVPIHPIKHAVIEFRFPASYELRESDFKPFVGSYTSNVDYLVKSEIDRCVIKSTNFAGNVTIRIEVESPLLRHMYGLAWNPRLAKPS